MSNPAVLMSIHARYADLILSGQKTVELRRRRPSFLEGTTILVYVPSPDRVVRGAFHVGAVVGAPVDELWQLVHERACVPREDFYAYFAGCDTGYAIEIKQPRPVGPVPLEFRPPQSYLVLRADNQRHTQLTKVAAQTLAENTSYSRKAAAAAKSAARVAAAAIAGAPGPLRIPSRRSRD